MNENPLKTAFFGTPHLAVYVLEELEAAGIVPDVVVTAPDRPAGRKLILTPPPVKSWALERDFPVLQPETLKTPSAAPELANSEWDLFIVAAYSIIVPPWVLELPKHGILNVHPSLLPKLRGPSPIRSAILLDRQENVGVSIIKLDEQVDHGPVVAQARVELPEWPVRGNHLDELLFREGGRLLAECGPLWLEGGITPEPQNDDEATFTKKFTKADGEINLDADAATNYRTFCAMEGWPGTYFFAEYNGTRIRVKVKDVEYTDGTFTPTVVIPEGKQAMSYDVFVRSLTG